MSEARALRIDVSELPSASFGHRSPLWWGTIAFIVIESMTLLTVAAAYLYVFEQQPAWPPPPTPVPDLALATLNLAVLLVTMIPMALAARRARDVDARGAQVWLWVAVGFSVLSTVLRVLEFRAVNTSWDEHAYGSLVWMLLGVHGTLILTDLFETAMIALLLAMDPGNPKNYTHVDEGALYQYFLSGIWVPVYALVYLLPRA
jgi:cytochrome c oxidase subunit III